MVQKEKILCHLGLTVWCNSSRFVHYRRIKVRNQPGNKQRARVPGRGRACVLERTQDTSEKLEMQHGARKRHMWRDLRAGGRQGPFGVLGVHLCNLWKKWVILCILFQNFFHLFPTSVHLDIIYSFKNSYVVLYYLAVQSLFNAFIIDMSSFQFLLIRANEHY